MGGIGAIGEPLVVIFLLSGGTWINRDFNPGRPGRSPTGSRRVSNDDLEYGGKLCKDSVDNPIDSGSTSPSLLVSEEPKWRKRRLGMWGFTKEVTTPNTRRFRGYFLSRILQRFPFLVECWYWALIYWVYQLGRAATAVWIVEGTVHVARRHALQVIAAEEQLHIFWELPIQGFFMKNDFVMLWINRIYSFIHIPGLIAFLVWLFYYTNTRNHGGNAQNEADNEGLRGSIAGPKLYESRRRTMAFGNLLAFILFTVWPCMPPWLLSADTSEGESGQLARTYGFVDTVHGPKGEGSIWTDNRFTNKFAAMPSLHFGYSLLIGLTICTIPLNPTHRKSLTYAIPGFNTSHPELAPKVKFPSWERMACVGLGLLYPTVILVAIIATANHFILDAVVGAMLVGLAWRGNDVMLNLLAVEDWFLSLVRIHKPERYVAEFEEESRENGFMVH